MDLFSYVRRTFFHGHLMDQFWVDQFS